MQIVVNDTNVFLDLIHAELIEHFFRLPFEVHTTDFILGEINDPEQEAIINQLVDSGKIIVASSSFEEVEEIMELQEGIRKLSIPDCSVWHYSKKNKFTLLTGDNLLRKTVKKDNIEVKGLLFIFDELVRLNIITPQTASIKLQLLLDMGTRLPEDECELRFLTWRS